jgi:hypothetical protein
MTLIVMLPQYFAVAANEQFYVQFSEPEIQKCKDSSLKQYVISMRY